MELETVLYRVEGNVGIVSLNRTKALNAMNKQIFVDLTTAFDAAEKDDNVRCVVVNAEGRAFCAGGDIPEMKGLDNPEAVFDFYNVAGIFMKKMINFVKPTITVAHGAIAGAGTSLKVIQEKLDQGIDVILEIEIQGAAKVREKMPEAVSLFLVPPSFEELSRRLHSRGTDSEETIQQRLATARREVKEIVNYDYIVVNDTVDQAVGEILAILIAEGCRKERRLDLIEGVNGL